MEKLKELKVTKFIAPILAFIGLLAFWGLNYIFLTPMAKSFGSIVYFGILSLIGIYLLVSIVSIVRTGTNDSNIIMYLISVLFVVGFIIYLFATSTIFKAEEYRSILPKPVEKDFYKEIKPFDVDKSPVVTENMAEQIADKKFGEYGKNLGSRATLGQFTLQNVNGDLFWIAPIEHSGFFSWKNNKNEGTPYVMVNANNKQSKIVDANIKYQEGSFFSQDIYRKLYSYNKSYLYTDVTFEVDDNLKPFYTATVYKNTLGISGGKVTGVVIVDSQSGEISEYTTKDTPKWVDRIQPLDFVIDNIDNSGELVNGFRPFNNTGKITSTEGSGLVYNEGKCYYYTGITSVGSDNSSLGFYLVDTRTMETTYFKMSGSTERAAMDSAEGKVQEKEYTASFPILMKVENAPTYFIPLQDKNELTKSYAMVNVEDFNMVGIGDNIESVRSDYIKSLSSKNQLSNSSGAKKEITGIVTRIENYSQSGNTYYSILLDNYKKIMIVPMIQSQEVTLTRDGDKISISYIESDSQNTQSLKFDNLGF